MDLVAVDLSHHNAEPDFATAKRAGLIGVIHKATEGSTYTDADYARRRLEAEDAGLKWASYHFLRHGNVPEQIAHYLGTVKPAHGERVCIDYEADDCTLDDLRAAVTEIWNASPWLEVTVYSGHLLKEQLGDAYDGLLAKTSLWIAQYNSEGPSWPKGTWATWTLWQYSDGSAGGSPRSIAGIPTPHDCNAFNGSRANCAAWFGPALDPEPAPVPDPAPGLVTLDITTPPGVSVRVSVNGAQLWAPEMGGDNG